MIIHQELKLDKNGKVLLRNVTEDDPAARDAAELRRQYAQEGNPKGWSEGKSWLHSARIPADIFMLDPLCKEYQRLQAAGNPEEARRVLRLFLSMNPQYRASEARL
jgi:hypothetical protein